MAKPVPADDSKTWAKAKDILTILVIPMLLWGVRQEIRLAQIETVVEDVAEVREEMHDLELQIAAMSRPLQANTQGVEELHIRLEHITSMLEDLDKRLIRD